MSVIDALYLVLLAGAAGYVLIGRVPSLLHTPMLSGSNFIHGIVLAGSMLALSSASGVLELIVGFVAVTAASANVVGGFVVTDRMLKLLEHRDADALRSDPREPIGNIVDSRSGSVSEQNRKSGNTGAIRSTGTE